MRDLYAVDAGAWATTASGLKEVRDLREIQLLCRVLANLNQKKEAEAADLLVQRVREVLVAKRPGGSWEKGELLSLLPASSASSTTLPEGGLVL